MEVVFLEEQEGYQYVVYSYGNGYITGIGEDSISGMIGIIANGHGIIGGIIITIIMPLLQQFRIYVTKAFLFVYVFNNFNNNKYIVLYHYQ